ncbi:MAG: MFS transporter [Lachnospiraceae bacterium]|nr:MFS transporter [Candidatus Merdinaster equi]
MKKLTKKWQLFLYAMSGMGVNMLNLMMGSYLCSALIAGGFSDTTRPFQTYVGSDLVIAALWGVFVFVAKIIDGVIDVPMASITDRFRSKWGRRRPSLMLGFIPMVCAYVLFLFIPSEGATILNTIYFGVVLCIFYSFYTLTMVTYYATFTEIVETEKERSTISNVKSFFDIVYYILGYVLVRALLNGINVRMVALMVLPLALTMLIPMFMIKEPSNKKGETTKEDAPKLIPSLIYTFKNKTFILWMVVYSFMTFGVQLFLGGINEFFSATGMSMIFVMMASFGPVPLTLLLFNKIREKKGFGTAYRYILIMFAVGMMLMFGCAFLENGSVVKMVCSIGSGLVSSLAIGAMFAVSYSVPAQLAADEEKDTGRSHAAMYFAVQGLFAGVATGIGTGLVLTALKKASESVTDESMSAIWFITVIAAGAMIISLLLSKFLPKSLVQMGAKENEEK